MNSKCVVWQAFGAGVAVGATVMAVVAVFWARAKLQKLQEEVEEMDQLKTLGECFLFVASVICWRTWSLCRL